MKSELTKNIEKALISDTASKMGSYGALEVTFDYFFNRKNMANRADYVRIDNKQEIHCFEIKVSMSDLESDARLAFFGHRNYLVVPIRMVDSIKKTLTESRDTKVAHRLHDLRLNGTGLIAYDNGKLKVISRCKRKTVKLDSQIKIALAIGKAASRDFNKLYLQDKTTDY